MNTYKRNPIFDAFGDRKNIEELPILDVGTRCGHTDYIDYITPQDMSHSIMRGTDMFRRPFISFRVSITEQMDFKPNELSQYNEDFSLLSIKENSTEDLNSIEDLCLIKDSTKVSIEDSIKNLTESFINEYSETLESKAIEPIENKDKKVVGTFFQRYTDDPYSWAYGTCCWDPCYLIYHDSRIRHEKYDEIKERLKLLISGKEINSIRQFGVENIDYIKGCGRYKIKLA